MTAPGRAVDFPDTEAPIAEQTLLVLKPDAVAARRIGEILRRVEAGGFAVTGLMMRHLNRAEAGEFYKVHRGKQFYEGLVEFIVSGPVVAVRLEGDGCRRRLREFVGATDPAKAAAGTIRRDYGTSLRHNAVHASNPDEDVAAELRFFYPEDQPKPPVQS